MKALAHSVSSFLGFIDSRDRKKIFRKTVFENQTCDAFREKESDF